MAGYSGMPLVKKLGIKPCTRVRVKGAPKHYKKLLGALSDDAVLSSRHGKDLDLIHLFTSSRSRLRTDLKGFMARIRRDGTIWSPGPRKRPASPPISPRT